MGTTSKSPCYVGPRRCKACKTHRQRWMRKRRVLFCDIFRTFRVARGLCSMWSVGVVFEARTSLAAASARNPTPTRAGVAARTFGRGEYTKRVGQESHSPWPGAFRPKLSASWLCAAPCAALFACGLCACHTVAPRGACGGRARSHVGVVEVRRPARRQTILACRLARPSPAGLRSLGRRLRAFAASMDADLVLVLCDQASRAGRFRRARNGRARRIESSEDFGQG